MFHTTRNCLSYFFLGVVCVENGRAILSFRLVRTSDIFPLLQYGLVSDKRLLEFDEYALSMVFHVTPHATIAISFPGLGVSGTCGHISDADKDEENVNRRAYFSETNADAVKITNNK
ncbi:hypothetical protein IV203_006217 [Nitzschia inconspicua]|uniref:Uncharacterized protein n=1 Tax=Nitzschia inconspicua TaxID=303405 RepID=A0A9K3KQ97_9STRA|nr:hypothetical protein IV203_006217 [Nitzschia inconspicua]